MQPTTLTLSVGGVSFTLTPAGDAEKKNANKNSSSVNFQSENNDGNVLLKLNAFTGTLSVSATANSSVEEEGSATKTPKMNSLKRTREESIILEHSPEASKKIREELEKADSSDDEDEDDTIVMRDDDDDEDEQSFAKEASPLERQHTNDSTPSQQSQLPTSSQHSSTLLGQPGLSQTQMDEEEDDALMLSQTTNDEFPQDDHPDTDKPMDQAAEEEEPRVLENDKSAKNKANKSAEKAKESRHSSPPKKEATKEEDEDDETQDINATFESDDKNNEKETATTSPDTKVESSPNAANKPARISMGDSPAATAAATKGHDPPCPRWGHTMAHIGKDRVLVYGGQMIDAKTKLPVTLKDVHLYDLNKKTWFKPFSGDGMPRQWHTATYLPDRQLLITFGGEALNPKSGKVKTENQVMVLDTDIFLWYPPACTGEIPSSRSGHSATVLGNDLVVFGGVKGSKWLNTVSVLDVTLWKWSSAKTMGAAPQPRSYHSAVAVKDRIIVFGGNNADKAFDSVHVLEKVKDSDKWKWSHPSVTGYKPKARTGHSATLLEDGKTICIYGGWDPNTDEIGEGDDEEMIFEDSFLLDTEKWTWRINKPVHGKEAKRVGHTAVVRGDEVVVFGGRVPGDTFTGDFQMVSVSK